MTRVIIDIFYMILCVYSCWATYRWVEALRDNFELEDRIAKINNTNPWRSQLMLMLKSDQLVARAPAITKTSVLYGALILEEAAETLVGLAQGVEEASKGRGSELYEIAVDLTHAAKIMAGSSIAIRTKLAATREEPSPYMPSIEVATEILDGITDLHVVVAGLGLACGLPGQAAYENVSSSNLSKANPVTGIIDKDAGGKWIKGPAYFKPDLQSLLSPLYAQSHEPAVQLEQGQA